METDAPYLTPMPYRGKENRPAYTKFIVEKIAELREISADEVAKATTENALRILVWKINLVFILIWIGAILWNYDYW